MTKIERWMAAFEAMDDRAQAEHLMMAEAAARAHPRRQDKRQEKRQATESRLALVASNMIVIRPAQSLGKPEHVGSATIIGAVK